MLLRPGVGDEIPERLRDAEARHDGIVGHGARDDFETQLFDLGRRVFDVVFYFAQGEAVAGAFIPVAFVVNRVKAESVGLGGIAPIVARFDRYSFHYGRPV